MRRAFARLSLLLVTLALPATAGEPQSPAAYVRAILDAPADRMSVARAKLAVDKFADPSIDEAATLAELDGMVVIVNKMLSTLPPAEAATDIEKMRGLHL